ncbi:MAG: polysaccharide deacetylase family protein [Candidatus Omnitrophota bacterium]
MVKALSKSCAGFILANPISFALLRHMQRKGLIILCYHRVIKREEINSPIHKGMCVDLGSFQRQMLFVSRNYACVNEGQVINALEGNGKLPDNPLWVTFDDGYKDNFTNAYPVLRKFNIPATFFITTDYIDKLQAENNLFMSWDEIRNLKNEGFSVGAHTKSHGILAELSSDKVIEEISESKERLERELGASVVSFAYPKGKTRHCNLEFSASVLKEKGFKLAVTTVGGINTLSLTDKPFFLKRVGTSFDDPFIFFKARLLTGSFWQK